MKVEKGPQGGRRVGIRAGLAQEDRASVAITPDGETPDKGSTDAGEFGRMQCILGAQGSFQERLHLLKLHLSVRRWRGIGLKREWLRARLGRAGWEPGELGPIQHVPGPGAKASAPAVTKCMCVSEGQSAATCGLGWSERHGRKTGKTFI